MAHLAIRKKKFAYNDKTHAFSLREWIPEEGGGSISNSFSRQNCLLPKREELLPFRKKPSKTSILLFSHLFASLQGGLRLLLVGGGSGLIHHRKRLL